MFDDPQDSGIQPPQPASSSRGSQEGLAILDTDIGYDPDDLVALVIAAHTVPNLTVVTADETRGRRARLARHVLDLLDRTDVPIIAGLDLGGEHRFLADHGPDAPRHPDTTGEELIDRIDQFNDHIARLFATATCPIRWVGMGPMSNLNAFITHAPDMADRLTVTQMGGWIDHYRDSHNFHTDPTSAGPTLRALPTPRLVLSEHTNSPFIHITRDWALLHRLSAPTAPTAPAWAHLLAAHFGMWFTRRPGSWMHDPLTLSAALDLPFVTFHCEPIRIGRDACLHRDPNGRPIEVSCAVDYDGFLDWMHEAVCP
ncbi:nucleoside hydrolase [Nocardia amikacinitolerans]|uniref:nucleoside hydrolase n=1 Tax=Nocardia amikacinitolerans TaxID=756689 RepID=UPI0036A84624